jgi:hypothetical protein
MLKCGRGFGFRGWLKERSGTGIRELRNGRGEAV